MIILDKNHTHPVVMYHRHIIISNFFVRYLTLYESKYIAYNYDKRKCLIIIKSIAFQAYNYFNNVCNLSEGYL